MIARPAPSIADPARPTATFAVARRELLGADTLLGAAELARVLCRAAERRITLVALTPGRLRRVDGWLTGDALVTHGAAPDPATPVVGALCARHHGAALVRSIIESLVGPVPSPPAEGPVRLPALTELASGQPPAGTDWLLVITATDAASGPDAPQRRCLAARAVGDGSDGLVGGTADDVTCALELAPVDAPTAWASIARLLGDHPPDETQP